MNKKLQESFNKILERKNILQDTDKLISLKDISRKGKHLFKLEKYTYLFQHNNKEKCFFFERLKRKKIKGPKTAKMLQVGKIEYRLSYFIVGKNGNKKDKWTFGQFCPTIPPRDFNKLLSKAKEEKVLR